MLETKQKCNMSTNVSETSEYHIFIIFCLLIMERSRADRRMARSGRVNVRAYLAATFLREVPKATSRLAVTQNVLCYWHR
jgi:hypothetical protein